MGQIEERVETIGDAHSSVRKATLFKLHQLRPGSAFAFTSIGREPS